MVNGRKEVWSSLSLFSSVCLSMCLSIFRFLMSDNIANRVGTRPLCRDGTGPLRRVGTGPLRRDGNGPLRRVGTGPLRRVGTGPLRRVGTGPLRRVGTVVRDSKNKEKATKKECKPGPRVSCTLAERLQKFVCNRTNLTEL